MHSIPVADEMAVHAGCDIVVDTLHVGRFGGTAEELAAAAARAPLVQLCDAPAARPATREGLVTESRSARLAPGEGGLDLLGVVNALEAGLARTPRAGSRLPVSVEVPNDEEVGRRGGAAWLAHLHETAARLLDRAPSPAPSTQTTPTPTSLTTAETRTP